MDVLALSCALPRSSRSTAATCSSARSGSGLAAVTAAGAELFKERGGAGGVQKTVEILQVPFVVVPRIQFIDRVCPSSCEQRQVSTGVAVPGQGC